MDDTYNLQRFVDAQAPVIDQVLEELREGRKRSHWMWYVFPQLRGLGHSAMAQAYGITGLDEARAYLSHPVLGPRLRECTTLVAAVQERGIHAIFGSPDDMKFRSCMTLFSHADPDDLAFQECLRKYFGGQVDALTEATLRRQPG
ncbi:DUF1810 domain-containing protein [Bordetella sp. LUAb4]|uniref:DUF1810 domain-containing protein n=1 Tax=Bordetella sp. LUAb4 TaxID=2843195 RepID=UPI001E5D63C6|nr:DUF1810 domain-containing protein [Bordetella sp. LUAb4]